MKNVIKIGAIWAFGMFSVCVGASVGASEIIKYFYDKKDFDAATDVLCHVEETWRKFPIWLTHCKVEYDLHK